MGIAWEWTKFWLGCFLDSSNIALAIVLWADGLVTVVSAFLLWKHGYWKKEESVKGGPPWNDRVMKLSFQIGAVVFAVSFLAINPFIQYKRKADEVVERGVVVASLSNDLRTTKDNLAKSESARIAQLEQINKNQSQIKKRVLNFAVELDGFALSWTNGPPPNSVIYYSQFSQLFEYRLRQLRSDLEHEAVHSTLFDEMCQLPSSRNDPNAFSTTNVVNMVSELRRLAEKL